MSKRFSRRRLVATGVTTLAAATATAGLAVAQSGSDVSVGPNTVTDPYLLPTSGQVSIESLLTVGDAGAADDRYEMVGIPDGIGLRANPRGRDFSLFMNHEIGPPTGSSTPRGIPRRHGQAGAFVSRFRIDPKTSRVKEGGDLIDPGTRFWDYTSQTYRENTASTGGANPRVAGDTFPRQTDFFNRFCSASITNRGDLFDRRSGTGTREQVYFANEEAGDEGRNFGVLPSGQAQQLPRLGLFSWENTLLAPTRSRTTLTMGNEDGANGQLWGYVGRKQRSGNAFERAGLTNGRNYVLDLADETVSTDAQFRARFGKGSPRVFTMAGGEEVNWDQSGARQNREAAERGLTLNRIEDGAFDPRNPNDYYFITTEGGRNTTRGTDDGRDGGGLWKVSFKDVNRPTRGTIELLLDGSERPFPNKPDNMTIDSDGNLLMQEDPGNNVSRARVLAYDIDTGRRGVLAQFDERLFTKGAPGLITIDEESSGIVDASRYYREDRTVNEHGGTFLLDAQIHKSSPDADKVELGQMLRLTVRDFRRVYRFEGDRALVGGAG